MRLVTFTLVLLAQLAHAVDLGGTARAWVGPGVDTNARRDFGASIPARTDGFAFVLTQLDGLLNFERLRLVAAHDLAARKFLTLPSEDTLIQNGQLEASWAFARAFAVGLAARGRDRRGAARDYSDLVGQLFFDFVPDDAVNVQLKVGAHRFLYWPKFRYSFFGPEGSLQARYRFNRRHGISVLGSLNPRTYHATTNVNPADSNPPPAVTRADTVAQAALTYSYRGPFHLTLGYTYYDQGSNSFGETIRRHRLSATLGVRLPWQLTLLTSGVLQLSQFPDGQYFSDELQVIDDDENSSSFTVKFVRPLTNHLDVDLRYALYVNVVPQLNFFYLRQVGSLGVSLHF